MLVYLYLSSNVFSAYVTDENGTAVPGATVTMTLLTSADVEVVGETWPATMVEDDPGYYKFTPAYDIQVNPNKTYKAEIKVTSGALHHYSLVDVRCKVDVH